MKTSTAYDQNAHPFFTKKFLKHSELERILERMCGSKIMIGFGVSIFVLLAGVVSSL